jgi:hypothetical protein
MVCGACGSSDIRADAYAVWSVAKQQWECLETFDKGSYCGVCDGEARIVQRELIDAEGEG